VIRRLGTLIIVVGLGLLAWCATVYLWKDPFTTAYTAWQQGKLESAYERRVVEWRARPDPPAARPEKANLRGDARAYRLRSEPGDALGRLEIPRLDVSAYVINGTEVDELRKGPGRHLETYMPGERELVYIAGHRTTYGAPFSDIDRLQPGDAVLFELPYGRFEYRVARHRIVDDNELSVLRTRNREELALQACHPRFFASQRYIVFATPVRVIPAQRASAG
jgi:sortase A